MTAPVCTNCGSGTDTPVGGLCPDCVADCYWIVRPEAHRETERRRYATEAPYYQSIGFEVLSAVPDGNHRWYCDGCNDPIPISGAVHLVPALGTWAFCIPCVSELGAWPEAWATPRACPCLACSPAADRPMAATA